MIGERQDELLAIPKGQESQVRELLARVKGVREGVTHPSSSAVPRLPVTGDGVAAGGRWRRESPLHDFDRRRVPTQARMKTATSARPMTW